MEQNQLPQLPVALQQKLAANNSEKVRKFDKIMAFVNEHEHDDQMTWGKFLYHLVEINNSEEKEGE